MRRRDFISLVGGAVSWPTVARGQEREQLRRVGVFVPFSPDSAEGKRRLSSFKGGLEALGWTDQKNVQLEYRFATTSDAVEAYAQELVRLEPTVIFTQGTPLVKALQKNTTSLPIVFAAAADPIGSGFAQTLSRPGGNMTGFMLYEESLTGKWLSLLKEVVPKLATVGLVINLETATFYQYYMRGAEAAAPRLGMRAVLVRIGNSASEIEQGIEAFAQLIPDGALIVPPDITAVRHRDLLVALAAKHHLPALFYERFAVAAGGLMSYGVDFLEQYRQSAEYVDRILRGTKPADLPVQAPTKYELAINLKTAGSLGLVVPATLLATADETIE
jgi:putative ABC transport system substrate-binding protein